MARVEAEVRPNTIDYLQREANSRRMTVEALAGELIERAVDLSETSTTQGMRQDLSPERKVELLIQLAKRQDPKIPPIPIEALDRDSLYDRDE